MAGIAARPTRARASGGREVALDLDELTYYRQPSGAPAYAECQGEQPLARRSYGHDTPTRVLATLDACTGRVVAYQGSKVGVNQWIAFYPQLRAAYPQAERLHVILDNWPVHYHPDVLVALEPQEADWLRYLPGHWSPEPSARPEAVALWETRGGASASLGGGAGGTAPPVPGVPGPLPGWECRTPALRGAPHAGTRIISEFPSLARPGFENALPPRQKLLTPM